jgi:hypothetical protein
MASRTLCGARLATIRIATAKSPAKIVAVLVFVRRFHVDQEHIFPSARSTPVVIAVLAEIANRH